jgi:membrane protein
MASLEAVGREPASRDAWAALGRGLRHPLRLLGDLATRLYEDDILTAAAALAFYFFFSIFPLVLFVMALASLLPVAGVETWLLENAAQSLPEQAYALLEGTLRSILETPRGGLVSIGAVLALWSASSAFAALINGINRAHRVRDPRPWWRSRLYAIGLTIALSLLMLLAFVLTVFGSQLVLLVERLLGPLAAGAAAVLRWGITLGLVMLVVAAIYYACPADERRWQWIRPGAVLFTLGFAASSALFSYYVSEIASYSATYGPLGAVIILLFWMYLLAFFLLAGAELNALLEEHVRRRAAERPPAWDAPAAAERRPERRLAR